MKYWLYNLLLFTVHSYHWQNKMKTTPGQQFQTTLQYWDTDLQQLRPNQSIRLVHYCVLHFHLSELKKISQWRFLLKFYGLNETCAVYLFSLNLTNNDFLTWLPVEFHIKVTLRAVFYPHCDQSACDLKTQGKYKENEKKLPKSYRNSSISSDLAVPAFK